MTTILKVFGTLMVVLLLVNIGISPNLNLIPIVNTTNITSTTNETYVLLDVPIADFKYNYLLQQKGILQNSYLENSCEKVAKDYQHEYGGNLVFITPYNTTTQEYVKSTYGGHWINRVTVNGTHIFIDYQMNMYFESENATTSFYTNLYGHSLIAKLFVYSEDEMPYPMIWHY